MLSGSADARRVFRIAESGMFSPGDPTSRVCTLQCHAIHKWSDDKDAGYQGLSRGISHADGSSEFGTPLQQ